MELGDRMAKLVLSCIVNDEPVEALVQPYHTLLETLRETLGLTDRAYIIYSGEVLMEGRADDIVNNPDVRRLYLGEEFRL